MIARGLRRCLHGRKGAAAFEFAIVASVFIALILGMIELGLLWWTRNALQLAAELTARCDALGSCADPSGFAAAQAGQWGLTGAVSHISITIPGQCHGITTASGKFVMVQMESGYWADLPPPFSGMTLQVSACYPVVS
ncbi:TadE/TadG family type IV pilus assembly protein [Gluconacetobacter tumulisoli]|uniref:Pilus assembly protein n=1 Tax=Gluconacetobacter tumulisoli TaxID=1286189 RepID=A0A7W4PP64_9PROT|nr:TadE/TadG family type IV pilus assembly protein [Gluconacetobacter tumulisoli]MBB2203304.1 pilus assembly protein [Gluconacetobacter tumulisoli]